MAGKFDLRNPIYNDDDAARAHLEALLWPQGPVCPHCGVMGNRITKLAGKSTRPGVYKCKDCRKPFSVTVGTVMERSHIPLSKWILASHFMSASKKGMSAHQLHRMIGTTYKTAWFLFHRLREAMNDPVAGPLGGEFAVVEVDETYVGGVEKNKHESKRKKGMQGGRGKAPVMALVDRNGKTRSFHVPNVTANTVRAVFDRALDKRSFIMTDENGVYTAVGTERFDGHGRVNHSKGEYVDLTGFVHTNSVESHFALLKRGIYGTFHHVSEVHLHRYLHEFDFRASNRHLDDFERSAALLTGAKGKRLYYRQPDGLSQV